MCVFQRRRKRENDKKAREIEKEKEKGRGKEQHINHVFHSVLELNNMPFVEQVQVNYFNLLYRY